MGGWVWVGGWVEGWVGAGDLANIMRLQLAWMPAGGVIRSHRDIGGYADAGHRIHVVLITNPGVAFHITEVGHGSSPDRLMHQQQQQGQQQGQGEQQQGGRALQQQQAQGQAQAQGQQQEQAGEGGEGGEADWLPIHVEGGLVFELNNQLTHAVRNGGAEARVHLVVDVADGPRARTPLAPGQLCSYKHWGDIDCSSGGGSNGGSSGGGGG